VLIEEYLQEINICLYQAESAEKEVLKEVYVEVRMF